MKKILSLILTLLIPICVSSCDDNSTKKLQSQIETLEQDKIELHDIINKLNNTIENQRIHQKELEEEIQELKDSNETLRELVQDMITSSPSNTPTYSPSPTPEESQQSLTVYITQTGSKYHRGGCQYLSQSSIAIFLSEAQSQGYTSCSKCF